MLHLQEPLTAMIKDRSCSPPGKALNGGYYAGTFRLNNENYALIVSPADSGEFSNVGWEAYRQITNASSYIDGFANTVAMAESGHVISQHSLQILINGFQDWYIPSRDELELIYRNLKPTTDVNLTSFRDGENPSSIPPGYAYTKAVPKVTSAKIFRTGEEQAMAASRYWSSTEASMFAAWTQHFKDGHHYTDHKIAAHKIRMVRKFKI